MHRLFCAGVCLGVLLAFTFTSSAIAQIPIEQPGDVPTIVQTAPSPGDPATEPVSVGSGEGVSDSGAYAWLRWVGDSINQHIRQAYAYALGLYRAGIGWIGQVVNAGFEALKGLSFYAALAAAITLCQVANFCLDILIEMLPSGMSISRAVDTNPVLAAMNFILPISEVLTWVQIVGIALFFYLSLGWLLRWLKVTR